MYRPLKLNLYLEEKLPDKALNQKGGLIDTTLINNDKFKYLRADSTIETFIHGSPKVESDVKLWFEFQNLSEKTQEEKISIRNNTVSFIITQLKKYSNVKVKNFKNETLVLKLFDLQYKTMDSYIEEWNSNVNIFGKSIIDIYMCGNLCTTDGKIICNYIITKKYENYLSLLKLEYNHVVKYIMKIMLFLQICDENNIIFRDLKFSSIGYEFIDSEIQFIVLDYNDTTLLNKNDTFFDTFKDGCDAMCVGTLVPYFIIHDFFEMEIDWKNKLNKLYSVGFAEILIFLLYDQNENMENILNIIYNPSRLKPCLHYYHYMKIFDTDSNKSVFFKLITTLKPKFIELESEINQMFIRIIQNCFEVKYENIKTTNSYLENLYKIYKDYNKEKSSVKTFIKPIETIDKPKPVESTKETEPTKPTKVTEPTESRVKIRQPDTSNSDLLRSKSIYAPDLMSGSEFITRTAKTTPKGPIPIETKRTEPKPIETKPIESKPQELEPIEIKRTEPKPQEPKPIETKTKPELPTVRDLVTAFSSPMPIPVFVESKDTDINSIYKRQ
jgi:hypothetical protein